MKANLATTPGSALPERGSAEVESPGIDDPRAAAASREDTDGAGLGTPSPALSTRAARTLSTVRLGIALVFILSAGLGSCICLVSH